MVRLVAWNFDLPNVIDTIDNGTFTEMEEKEIESHISNLKTYYAVHATISAVGTAIALTMLCLTLNRVWEIKHGISRSGIQNFVANTDIPKIVWQLLIFNFFSVLATSFALLTYTGFIDAYDKLGCDIMWKANVTFYIISMHMSYWILLARAGAVLDTVLFHDHRKTHKLRLFVHNATYMFYLAYPLPFITMGHVSLPPNICIYYSSPLIVIFVLISDSIFSILLLALFMLPMFTMGKMMSKIPGHSNSVNPASHSSASDSAFVYTSNIQHGQIKHTIRRQLGLSILALSSTLTFTVYLTIVSRMWGEPTIRNLGSQYWRITGGWAFISDCIMQSVAIHLITNAWRPSWFTCR